MNDNIENGINLVPVAWNTFWKTLGGVVSAIGIGVVMAFTVGVVAGMFLPFISFFFLFMSDSRITWLSAPKGSYVWWRIKMFLYCWVIGITCWLIYGWAESRMGL